MHSKTAAPMPENNKLAQPVALSGLMPAGAKDGDYFTVEGRACVRVGKLELEEASATPERKEVDKDDGEESAFGAGSDEVPKRPYFNR